MVHRAAGQETLAPASVLTITSESGLRNEAVKVDLIETQSLADESVFTTWYG